MFQLLLLFTVIPVVEIWLLAQLSGYLGIVDTVLLVLATGIVGAALARWQGFQAIRRLQNEMRQGMIPAGAIGDGFLIFAAGLLLVTPGVLTDVVGLSLLIPPARKLAMRGLKYWLGRHFKVQTHTAYGEQAGHPPGKSTIIDAKVIDAHVVDSKQE